MYQIFLFNYFPHFAQEVFGRPGLPSPVCFGSWQAVDTAVVLNVTEDPPFIFFKVS
jgi:hypothetical protein